MMMQSGMVKQSVDFTSSIKAFDGTIIEQGFYKTKSTKKYVTHLYRLSLSTYFFYWTKTKHHQMLSVFC